MEATSTTAMVGAVLAGVGPAIVTPYAVRPALETGELVAVPHALDLERPLTAIWRKDRALEGAAAVLLRIAAGTRRKRAERVRRCARRKCVGARGASASVRAQ